MDQGAEDPEVIQLRKEFHALHEARLAEIARMRAWQIQTYGAACEIYPGCICEWSEFLRGRCAVQVAKKDKRRP